MKAGHTGIDVLKGIASVMKISDMRKAQAFYNTFRTQMALTMNQGGEEKWHFGGIPDPDSIVNGKPTKFFPTFVNELIEDLDSDDDDAIIKRIGGLWVNGKMNRKTVDEPEFVSVHYFNPYTLMPRLDELANYYMTGVDPDVEEPKSVFLDSSLRPVSELEEGTGAEATVEKADILAAVEWPPRYVFDAIYGDKDKLTQAVLDDANTALKAEINAAMTAKTKLLIDAVLEKKIGREQLPIYQAQVMKGMTDQYALLKAAYEEAVQVLEIYTRVKKAETDILELGLSENAETELSALIEEIELAETTAGMHRQMADTFRTILYNILDKPELDNDTNANIKAQVEAADKLEKPLKGKIKKRDDLREKIETRKRLQSEKSNDYKLLVPLLEKPQVKEHRANMKAKVEQMMTMIPEFKAAYNENTSGKPIGLQMSKDGKLDQLVYYKDGAKFALITNEAKVIENSSIAPLIDSLIQIEVLAPELYPAAYKSVIDQYEA